MPTSKVGTALVLADLERSASFYRDTLSLRMTGIILRDFDFIVGGRMALALRQAPGTIASSCRVPKVR